MNFKDLFNFRMSAHGKALKGDKTDEDLEVELLSQELPDKRTISYLAMEKGNEVFLTKEGEKPILLKDETYLLSDESHMVILEGKISEIILKKEEPEAVELSEEHKKLIQLAEMVGLESLAALFDMSKDGYHTIELGVQGGKFTWGESRSSTYQALLSEQVDPVKLELSEEKAKVVTLEADKVKLSDEVKVLQELNDQKNPLKGAGTVDQEPEMTPYEKAMSVK